MFIYEYYFKLLSLGEIIYLIYKTHMFNIQWVWVDLFVVFEKP